jgi:hypothetical protein
MPNMHIGDLSLYVQKKHGDAGIRMKPSDASRYAKTLIAEKAIKVSSKNVRGRNTKKKQTVGGNFKPGGLAYKIGDFGPGSKRDLIALIMQLTGKTEEEAERCLKDDLSKRGAAIYDAKSKTWRGWRVPVTDLLHAKFIHPLSEELFEKQKEYWEVYGEAPGVQAMFAGGLIISGDIVPWTIVRYRDRGEDITETEALNRMNRARNRSRFEERTPIEAIGGKVYGKNWYRHESFLDLPRSNYQDPFGEPHPWIRSHILAGASPERHLAQAIECGDVDPKEKIGMNVMQAEIKANLEEAEREAIEAERKRQEAEAKAAEEDSAMKLREEEEMRASELEAARWIASPSLRNVFSRMPEMRDEGDFSYFTMMVLWTAEELRFKHRVTARLVIEGAVKQGIIAIDKANRTAKYQAPAIDLSELSYPKSTGTVFKGKAMFIALDDPRRKEVYE